MKKRVMELVMALVMLSIIYVIASQSDYQSVLGNVSKDTVVVIDPGHGGIDPGKVGSNNVLEKDINLQIAIKLKALLEDKDIKVVMTRDGDYGLYKESDSNKKSTDMKKRCQIINESNAALAVSIHQNSYRSQGIKGAQVFYYYKSDEGNKLAGMIQNQLVNGVDKENGRKEKSNSDYYILINSDCPAVIVECGFLSNPEELSLLINDEYQDKIALAVHKGIIEYLNKK